MIPPNEFWLQVHRLVAVYDAEGLDATHRSKNIVDQFHGMSPIAQRELAADLLRLDQ